MNKPGWASDAIYGFKFLENEPRRIRSAKSSLFPLLSCGIGIIMQFYIIATEIEKYPFADAIQLEYHQSGMNINMGMELQI